MITFIHPYAFLWLLLAVPLVLFYLWRARRPQAVVVTGALWQKAIPLLHPRRAWQKQRWFVSLLVQLAILLVLVTALAEPCWRRPQRVVLVLDATASMSVQNRFEDAKEQAKKLVKNMGYVDSLAVITAGERIGIHSRMSHDREQILASFDSLPKAGGTAPIDEAVSMAKSLITAGTGGVFDSKTNHIVLISDGCFPLAERVLKDEAVRWIPVGKTVGNVQLERLCAERREPGKPENAEIFVSLRSFSEKRTAGKLTISWKAAGKEGEEEKSGQKELSVEIPSVNEGGLLTQTIPVTEPREMRIQAKFQPENAAENAFLDDDSAQTHLHEAFTYRVTVVSPQEPNVLLENALKALPGVTVEQKVLKKSIRLGASVQQELTEPRCSTDESGVKRFSVVIFDRTLPSKSAEAGPFLFFAPPESISYWTRSETARDYVVMPWMDGLRSGISTAGVGFNGAHALTPDSQNLTVSPWLFSQSALEVNENLDSSEEEENFAKQAKTVEMTELAWGLELRNSAASAAGKGATDGESSAVSESSAASENSTDSETTAVSETVNGSDAKADRFVLTACDLTQSDWILADDFPRFLQYAFDWLTHTPASDARIAQGLEKDWLAEDSFADSCLRVPNPPEKIFVFPGEDIVPMWTILALIVCGAMTAEWYFYQRRWIE